MDFDLQKTITDMIDNAIKWSPRIVGFIAILIIGFWIANRITKVLRKTMKRSDIDENLIPFLSSLLGAVLKVLVVITAASYLGIEMTAFAALLAAAGLALGMALQGTLGHFASGVMILIFKPYKVGDLVNLQDQLGHVEEIQVFNTVLTTLDNKRVIIPNGVATSGIMTNMSTKGKLRVDLTVAMAYEEDFENVQGIIRSALDNVSKRLPDEPTIEILNFDENNVNITVRPFAKPEDYWSVYFDSYSEIKKALGREGIKVAYPRRELVNVA